ncbi:DUF4374 domain-containing protein [Pedobacter steynii]
MKAGATEFDQSYFMNFEQASNGNVITNWLYIGGNKFIAHVEPKATRGAYKAGIRLAIVNVADKTVTPVTGLPEVSTIVGLTTNNYTPKDGRYGYFGVNLLDGSTWVYKVDANTATATKGLEVKGGKITAIQHLQ